VSAGVEELRGLDAELGEHARPVPEPLQVAFMAVLFGRVDEVVVANHGAFCYLSTLGIRPPMIQKMGMGIPNRNMIQCPCLMDLRPRSKKSRTYSTAKPAIPPAEIASGGIYSP
jgi:hypothetical protein